jgi:hypothetical protein
MEIIMPSQNQSAGETKAPTKSYAGRYAAVSTTVLLMFAAATYLATRPVKCVVPDDIGVTSYSVDNQQIGVIVHNVRYTLPYNSARSKLTAQSSLTDSMAESLTESCALSVLASQTAINAYESPTTFKPWVGEDIKKCMRKHHLSRAGFTVDGFDRIEANFRPLFIEQMDKLWQLQNQIPR